MPAADDENNSNLYVKPATMKPARAVPAAPPSANSFSGAPFIETRIVAALPGGSVHEIVVEPAPDPFGSGFGEAEICAPAVVLVPPGDVVALGVVVFGGLEVMWLPVEDALPQPASTVAVSTAAHAPPRARARRDRCIDPRQ